MDRQELVDGLYFNDQIIPNHDVQSVTATKLKAFVIYGNRHLTAELDAVLCKFVAKALFIRRLKKAGSEGPVDFDSQSNDLSADRVKFLVSFQFLRAFAPSW